MCRKSFLLISLVLLLGLVVETVVAGVDPNTDPNLVGFWRFEDGSGLTAVDSSAYYGRDGTLINMDGTTEWVAGKAGGALDFDGTEDYVHIADYNGVLGNDPRTAMFWLKAPASVGGYPDGDWFRSVLGWGTNSSKQKWNITLNYGWVFISTKGAWAKAGQQLVADDTWHHVAVVLPDINDATVGDIQIYIDGVAENPMEYGGTTTNIVDTNAPDANVSNVYIGQYAEAAPDDPAKQLFLGMIDEVRIYDRALDANEIMAAMRYEIAGLAWNPYPATYATNVSRNVTLTWSPGDFAVRHDVYLGTDATAVADANRANPLGVLVSQNQDANSYPASNLALYQTYYWRIDEVNDANVDSPWKGPVWEFTTKDAIEIDDFESYTGAGTTGDSDLKLTWTQEGEATLYLMNGEALEPSHWGQNAMEIWYYNGGGYDSYSAGSRTPDTTDWTADGIETVLLWFKGKTINDGAEFYVELEDNLGAIAKLTYNDANGTPDVNAIQNPDWSRWMIDLQDFVDANNVDLGNVARFAVGIGDKDAAPPASRVDGYVYIDDIRIKTPHCYAWDAAFGGSNWPDVDINRDCVVDFEDLGIMVNNWLGTGISAVP